MDAERNLVDKQINATAQWFLFVFVHFLHLQSGGICKMKAFQMMHEIHITPKTLSDSRRAHLQFFGRFDENFSTERKPRNIRFIVFKFPSPNNLKT